MAQKTFTPKEIAAEMGITPKALRKLIRDNENGLGIYVGKGHRHALTAANVKALKKAFAEKAAKRPAAKPAMPVMGDEYSAEFGG